MLVDSVSNLTSMVASIIPRIGEIERAVNGGRDRSHLSTRDVKSFRIFFKNLLGRTSPLQVRSTDRLGQDWTSTGGTATSLYGKGDGRA
jgi:hypothetical protein